MPCKSQSIHHAQKLVLTPFRMNYGKKTPSTYRSTPSVYSHVTGRWDLLNSTSATCANRNYFRTSNMGRTRSMKSVRIPWYQKPLITNNKYFDVQRGSMLMGFFAIVNILDYNWQFPILNLRTSFADCGLIHHCDRSVRHLLPSNGRSWIHSLRLLHIFVWICVCGQRPW